METNAIIDFEHEVQDRLWVEEVNEIYKTGRLCLWVSTFHPKELYCKVEGTFYNGSFNAGLKMVFSDKTAWMVRFPRGGKVHSELADEKVAMEVTTLNLIHDRTNIPVPTVHAWGTAKSNPLDLGPFIIMDFIDGVSLSSILRDPNAEYPRLMTENVAVSDIEFIYRQMANLMLELFKLDFDCIGSLPWPGEHQGTTPTRRRPLTYKAHTILQDGGVNTFGDRNEGFATTTEYFRYVVEQDLQQLIQQPNSIVGPNDARNKYLSFKALAALLPGLIRKEYDHCKFKLICDDLGLANLIVQGQEDLTVVGVVDLEWSYIGPAQLFASAPWWLLLDRPVNSSWDYEDSDPPKTGARYFDLLKMFIRVLEEEEAKTSAHAKQELSDLIKWSQSSGAMWLHMLLSSGFNSNCNFPFMQLRQHIGSDRWETLLETFNNPEALEKFTERKLRELNDYEKVLDKLEKERGEQSSGVTK
ncbi:hypothetical protein BDW66DRAFT_163693 [Aspergillus desertorum]